MKFMRSPLPSISYFFVFGHLLQQSILKQVEIKNLSFFANLEPLLMSTSSIFGEWLHKLRLRTSCKDVDERLMSGVKIKAFFF